MDNRIKIGIIGGGNILGAHAPGFMKLRDECVVTVVAEPEEGKAARIHQLLGDDVRIVPDYRDVIGDPDIDAVDILLPHDMHMPVTIAAAEAGKPVLTEKVMARNVYECDRMIEACENAGVSLTVCHDRRYHGEWMALKDVVDSGALGEILYWKLEHNQNVCMPEGTWIRSYNRLGGGAIMSCLTHQIDALRWYDGEVCSVTCMTKTVPERMEGEAMGVVTAQMKSGALAHLSINWMTHSHNTENGLWYEMNQVCGTKGEAYYMSGKGTYVLLYDEAEANREWTFGDAGCGNAFKKVESGTWSGHDRCIEEWVKSLRGMDAPITTSGRECRGTVEVAEAAYLSVNTGKTISLPITPQPWRDR